MKAMNQMQARTTAHRIQAAILSALVLLAVSTVNPAETLVHQNSLRLSFTFFWQAVLFAAVIVLAVVAARKPTAVRLATLIVVLTYAISALLGSTVLAWLDFASVDGNDVVSWLTLNLSSDTLNRFLGNELPSPLR